MGNGGISPEKPWRHVRVLVAIVNYAAMFGVVDGNSHIENQNDDKQDTNHKRNYEGHERLLKWRPRFDAKPTGMLPNG